MNTIAVLIVSCDLRAAVKDSLVNHTHTDPVNDAAQNVYFSKMLPGLIDTENMASLATQMFQNAEEKLKTKFRLAEKLKGFRSWCIRHTVNQGPKSDQS